LPNSPNKQMKPSAPTNISVIASTLVPDTTPPTDELLPPSATVVFSIVTVDQRGRLSAAVVKQIQPKTVAFLTFYCVFRHHQQYTEVICFFFVTFSPPSAVSAFLIHNRFFGVYYLCRRIVFFLLKMKLVAAGRTVVTQSVKDKTTVKRTGGQAERVNQLHSAVVIVHLRHEKLQSTWTNCFTSARATHYKLSMTSVAVAASATASAASARCCERAADSAVSN